MLLLRRRVRIQPNAAIKFLKYSNDVIPRTKLPLGGTAGFYASADTSVTIDSINATMMGARHHLPFLGLWLAIFISYLAILDTSYAEKNIGENLDEQIAFDVPGQQQPISFSFNDHSTGYIVYCPCMGKS